MTLNLNNQPNLQPIPAEAIPGVQLANPDASLCLAEQLASEANVTLCAFLKPTQADLEGQVTVFTLVQNGTVMAASRLEAMAMVARGRAGASVFLLWKCM